MTQSNRNAAIQALIQAYAHTRIGGDDARAEAIRKQIHEAVDASLDEIVEELRSSDLNVSDNSVAETPENVVAIVGRPNGEKEVVHNA